MIRPPFEMPSGTHSCPGKVPSVVKAKPYCSPLVSFFAASTHSAQVAGGLTPALSRRSLW